MLCPTRLYRAGNDVEAQQNNPLIARAWNARRRVSSDDQEKRRLRNVIVKRHDGSSNETKKSAGLNARLARPTDVLTKTVKILISRVCSGARKLRSTSP